MTSSDLCSRINLQAFCDANKLTGFSFVKMPRFGWFAINQVDGTIQTLIDFIPKQELVAFCTDLIVEKQQYHDGRIYYNEQGIIRLANDIRILLTYKKFHMDCMTEFMEGQHYVGGYAGNLNQTFERNGMAAFKNTGVGLVTGPVLQTYKKLLYLDDSLKNKLVIPTWCTPQHFCSFEYCAVDAPTNRHTFFIHGEKGWYGKPVDTVYGNFSNLLTHDGCTWDKKVDYWVEKPLALDDSLAVNQCLQIWTEARNAKFKRSPLDVIEANGGVAKLKFNVSNLTLNQITELQKKFDIQLKELWEAQKQSQVEMGRLTFIAKNMRYYVQTSAGTIQEFTNFLMEVNRIYKKEDKFYRQGIIYYEGKEVEFEFPNDDFLSVKNLTRALNNFFLTHGIGVPIVSTTYRSFLLDVINKLNVGCMIDPVG